MPDAWREIPPTAGLPLRASDLIPRSGKTLQDAVAAFLGVPAVQLECSGTAALIVALTALMRHSPRRRRVVLPAYTCPLVALAVMHCGLTPVLCDVRRDHFDFSPEMLASLVDDETLAIIPTHLGGRVADVTAVNELARRYQAPVIEDAAQALGAQWHDRAAGTAGDLGFFSLAVRKGLTLYEGGVLFARDDAMRRQLREESRRVAPFRPGWEIRRSLQLLGYTAFYRPSALRYVYGRPLRRALAQHDLTGAVGDDFPGPIPLHTLGGLRRSVGVNALKRLPGFIAMTTHQAKQRKTIIESIEGVTVIGDPDGSRGTWPFFMVLMPGREARDAALGRLWTAGLGVSRLFIHAIPDYPSFAAQFAGADVPNARDFAARMLTITNSPWLGEDDFQRILATLGEAVTS